MLSVMIAEPDDVTLVELRRLLAYGAQNLFMLDDCRQADETLRNALALKPDILFVDLALRAEASDRIIRRLRAGGFAGKIIVCSADTAFESVRDALNDGADAYLTLPVGAEALSAAIKRMTDEIDRQEALLDRRIRDEIFAYFLPDYILSDGHGADAQKRRSIRRFLYNNIGGAGFAVFALPQEARVALSCKNLTHAQINRRIALCISERLPRGYTLLRIADFDGWVVFHYTEMKTEMAIIEAQLTYMTGSILNAVQQSENAKLLSGVTAAYSGLDEAPQAYARAVRNLRYNTLMDILAGLPSVRGVTIDEEAVDHFLSTTDSLDAIWKKANALFKAHLNSNLISAGNAFDCAVALLLFIQRRIAEASDLEDDPETWSKALEEQYPETLDTTHVTRWFTHASVRLKQIRAKVSPIVADDILFNACQYIQMRFREDLSLAAVSQFAGVSTSYLSYLFSERLNTRFVDYVTAVRMEELKRLLAERDYTVAELCEMLGYNTPTYFCRVVKQKTGKTVKQLRYQLGRRG